MKKKQEVGEDTTEVRPGRVPSVLLLHSLTVYDSCQACSTRIQYSAVQWQRLLCVYTVSFTNILCITAVESEEKWGFHDGKKKLHIYADTD